MGQSTRHRRLDGNGKLANDGTRQFLQQFMQAYGAWVSANTKA